MTSRAIQRLEELVATQMPHDVLLMAAECTSDLVMVITRDHEVIFGNERMRELVGVDVVGLDSRAYVDCVKNCLLGNCRGRIGTTIIMWSCSAPCDDGNSLMLGHVVSG